MNSYLHGGLWEADAFIHTFNVFTVYPADWNGSLGAILESIWHNIVYQVP